MQKNLYDTVLREYPLSLPPTPFGADMWQRLKESDTPILIYGMGNGADKLFERLASLGRVPSAVFASDGFVRGQIFRGHKVVSYAEARERFPEHVVLLSFGSNKEDVVSYLYEFAEDVPLLIPDMPLAGEEYFTSDFYKEHLREIATVYGLLADDASRDLLASLVWYKLTGEPCFLSRAVCFADTRELLGWNEITAAVDVGAYRGDTLKELAEHAPRLSYVLAIEPDRKNFRRLLEVASRYPALSVTCVEGAAWNEDGDGLFEVSGNRNATLSAEGKKGHTPSFEHKTETIKTFKIDTLTEGRTVDYIKYDTEGAEMAALSGTEACLKTHTPRLRVSAYHRSEDIFALPLYLASSLPDCYQYYLRRTHVIPAWECDLIAVPKEKGET